MGMSIDNHIEILKSCQYGFGFTGYAGNLQDSIDVAVDIMCKYQKIQEVIADWKSDGDAFEMSELYWLRLISEVVEDENDD